MKPSVYIETTVVSYLTARPATDIAARANQLATRKWWDLERLHYDLKVSQPVLTEASRGDAVAAADRLVALKDIDQIAITAAVLELAESLIREVPLPPQAAVDAIHIAAAAVHGVQFLLTWNCRHIANAKLRVPIERACRASGYEPPILCTPAELMESDDD